MAIFFVTAIPNPVAGAFRFRHDCIHALHTAANGANSMSELLEALRTRQPLATANLRGMQDRHETPPEVDELAADPDDGMNDAIALIGRASRALLTNKAAAADLLREAAKLLRAIADEVTA